MIFSQGRGFYGNLFQKKLLCRRLAGTTLIIYNSRITLRNIPEKAYEYVVNGKSAIEWVMERYAFYTDQASGIVDDPNAWSKEHNDPAYILKLLKSVIRVSVETVEIVSGLPSLD